MAEATAPPKVKITREEATTVGPPPPGGWKDESVIKEIAADLDRVKAAADAAAAISEEAQAAKKKDLKLLQRKKAYNKAKPPQVALVDEIHSVHIAAKELVVLSDKLIASHNNLLAQNTAFRNEIQELKAELRTATNLFVTIAKCMKPDLVPENKP